MRRRVARRIGKIDAAVQRLGAIWFIVITAVAAPLGFSGSTLLVFSRRAPLTSGERAWEVTGVAICVLWLPFAFMWLGRRTR